MLFTCVLNTIVLYLHSKTNEMETITITKRIIKGKEVYNKRFDDYDNGFYGEKISKTEYEESKLKNKYKYREEIKSLNIIERITYEN